MNLNGILNFIIPHLVALVQVGEKQEYFSMLVKKAFHVVMSKSKLSFYLLLIYNLTLI